MQLAVKLIISLCVIGIATFVGRKFPSLTGLIGVMPLTGALVMVWLYMDTAGDSQRMISYTRGAIWGIVPTILFFLVAWVCFRRQMPLWIVLCGGFGIWLLAAFVHQWLVGD